MIERLAATRTVGLERSRRFLDQARRSWPELEFVGNRVTTAPFPVESANLIFAGLPLTHLPDPAQTLAALGDRLSSGGLRLADDLEYSRTEQLTFATYRDIAVAAAGGDVARKLS